MLIELACLISIASFIGVPEKQITGVSATSVEVEGLIPFLDYTFSVTAENAVSSQDRDVTDRTANINITTEEGGKKLYQPI